MMNPIKVVVVGVVLFISLAAHLALYLRQRRRQRVSATANVPPPKVNKHPGKVRRCKKCLEHVARVDGRVGYFHKDKKLHDRSCKAPLALYHTETYWGDEK